MNFKLNPSRWAIALLCLFATACTLIPKPNCTLEESGKNNCSSSLISKAVDPSKPNVGVLYSLPTQTLEFTIKREKVTETKLKKAVEDAQQKVDKITKESTSKKKEISQLELQIKKGAKASEKALGTLGLKLELARIESLVVLHNLNQANSKLETAQLALKNFKTQQAQGKAKPYKDTFSLAVTNTLPDPEAKLVTRVNQTWFNSETFEIKTNDKGLLSGGMSTSEGQADDIFVSLVNAVATVKANPLESSNEQLFTPSFLTPSGSSLTPCTNKPQENSFRYVFDMDNGFDARSLQDKLVEAGFCYFLQFPSGSFPTKQAIVSNLTYNGLVYRGTTTLKFELFELPFIGMDLTNTIPIKKFYQKVIDPSALAVLPLTRGRVATNKYEFDFKDGMLTRYKSVTPNEFIELLNTIPRAGKALLSIPTEILQLKINYSSAEQGHYEAQAAAIKARKVLADVVNGIDVETDSTDVDSSEDNN